MFESLVAGRHAAFILAAYGATLAVVLGLIAWVAMDLRAQRKTLAELEARGIRRRSAPGRPP